MTEYNDEYFINLVMKINEKNFEVLTKWIEWCDASKGRYYIAADDEDLYTATRTPEEAEIELQRQKMLGYIDSQRDALNLDEANSEMWLAYEDYATQKIDSGEFLTSEVMPYEVFKK